MREICGEFFIFQPANVSAHGLRGRVNLLKQDSCVHFIRFLVPNSADLKSTDYKNMQNMGEMQQRV